MPWIRGRVEGPTTEQPSSAPPPTPASNPGRRICLPPRFALTCAVACEINQVCGGWGGGRSGIKQLNTDGIPEYKCVKNGIGKICPQCLPGPPAVRAVAK